MDWGINLKNKITIFNLLVFYFIILAVIIFGLYLGAQQATSVIFETYNIVGDELEFSLIDDKLKTEDFSNINYDTVFGNNNEVWIVDSNGKNIYSHRGDTIKLTKNELQYLYDFRNPKYTSLVDYDYNGKKIVSVTMEYVNQEELNKIYILDNTGKVLISNDSNKTSFTQEELSVIKNSNNPYGKYEFTTNKGNKYYLITNYFNAIDHSFDAIYKQVDQVYLFFMIMVIGVVLLFIFVIKQSIIKPITLLKEAISEFKNTKEGKNIKYKGANEFVSIIENFNDLTTSLEEANQLQKEHENEKSKMLSNVSHDLKTPITVIQGYSIALSDGIVPKEKEAIYLKVITDKATQLNELVNQFYEYSKLEHPDYRCKFIVTEMREFLERYFDKKSSEIDLRNDKVIVDFVNQTVFCNIDILQFTRALDNLINNAVKHNKDGIIIHASMEVDEHNVYINIEDNGVGIPKDRVDRIFDAFVVNDDARSNNTSGLGLTICKKIIEMNGGSIEIMEENYLYKARFRIVLPKYKKS